MKYRFTPVAFQKLKFFMDFGKTEVSGFGITDPDDPLLIIDFHLVKQTCTSVTTEMEELDQYLIDRINEGHTPKDCFRVWIHTHPGSSPNPSGTDIATLEELLGRHQWFVMLILAQEGLNWHGEIGYSVGPEMERYIVDIGLDWDYPIDEIVDFEELEAEYNAKVKTKKSQPVKVSADNAAGYFSSKKKFDANYEQIAWDENLWGRYEKNNDDDDIDYLDEVINQKLKEMTTD